MMKSDYEQWQRRSVSATSGRASSVSSESKALCGERYSRLPRKSGTGCISCGHHDSLGSKTQIHGTRHRQKPPPPKPADRTEVLLLRIVNAKKSLEEYRQREVELWQANLELKEELEADELKMHEDVKQLLRKYEKFRGGMSNMNTRFQTDVEDARKNMELLKVKSEEKLTSLEEELKEKVCQLKAKQNELFVLKNYKDKDYPVKSLRIRELEKRIELLKMEQEEKEQEVFQITESEYEKMQKNENKTVNNIKKSVAEDAATKVNSSAKDLAAENHSLENEVKLHSQHIAVLEENIRTLKTKIKKLQQDPNTDVRRAMFPELFVVQPICTPDMEVILDIQHEECLPI